MIPNTDPQSNTFVISYINLPSSLQLCFIKLSVNAFNHHLLPLYYISYNPNFITKRAFKSKMADVLPLWRCPRLLWESLSSQPSATWVLNFWILFRAKIPLPYKYLTQKLVKLGNQMRKKGGEARWLEGERNGGWEKMAGSRSQKPQVGKSSLC